MQALAINAARNSRELWLPARDHAPARRASFYRGFFLFRPLHSEGVSGSNAFFRGLKQLPRNTPHRFTAQHMTNSITAAVPLWLATLAGRDPVIRKGIRGRPPAPRGAGQAAPNSPIC